MRKVGMRAEMVVLGERNARMSAAADQNACDTATFLGRLFS